MMTGTIISLVSIIVVLFGGTILVMAKTLSSKPKDKAEKK